MLYPCRHAHLQAVFFLCLQAIIEVIFPRYCTATLDVPLTNAGTNASVASIFREDGMHEITPDEYEACIDSSLLVTYRYTCATVVWVAFPSILIAGFVLNAWVDCTHSGIELESGASGSEEDVGELLVSIDPRFSKYVLRFNAADITTDQLPFLEKRDFLHIGVTLGDAIRIIAHFHDGLDGEASSPSPLRTSNKPSEASGAVDAPAGSAGGAAVRRATAAVSSTELALPRTPTRKAQDAVDKSGATSGGACKSPSMRASSSPLLQQQFDMRRAASQKVGPSARGVEQAAAVQRVLDTPEAEKQRARVQRKREQLEAIHKIPSYASPSEHSA